MTFTDFHSTSSSINWVHSNIAEHLPAMKRFAMRLLGPAGEVDDLVQETVMRALGAADQFKPGTALKSWLFTIMRNTFCTAYQRKKREVVGIEDGFSRQLSISPPQEWAIQQEEMRKAIARLPLRSCRPLLLVSMGTSYDEVARLCGCEIGTVKSRVNRAHKQLADELGGARIN